MSDVALVFNPLSLMSDFNVTDGDLLADDGLETAVQLSLFCHRRALKEDDFSPTTDRKGWWGDAFPVTEGDFIGSRLWELANAKQMPSVVQRAKDYCEEALKWMVEDGVTDDVVVQTSNPSTGVLLISISISRPKVDPVTFRYNFNWIAQEVKRVI